MRVASAPFGQHLSSFRQRFAHRRATQAARLEPDRELQRAAYHATLDLTIVLLNPDRVLIDNRDWVEDALRKIAAKPRADAEATVGDHPNIEISPYSVGLGALGDEPCQGLVEHVRNELGFATATLHRFVHRARLVDDEEEAGRIRSVDLRRVRHILAPLRILSHDLCQKHKLIFFQHLDASGFLPLRLPRTLLKTQKRAKTKGLNRV